MLPIIRLVIDTLKMFDRNLNEAYLPRHFLLQLIFFYYH